MHKPFSLSVCAALAALTLAPVPARALPRDVFLAIGPMLHFNIPNSVGGPAGVSLALEGSYWDLRDRIPWGADIGIEYDFRKRTRIYAEAEAGAIMAGGAIGPVLEFGPKGPQLGLQLSAWADWFLGVDLRGRIMVDGEREYAPGVFGKWPFGKVTSPFYSDEG